jgi:hypothetical protein
MPDIEIAVRENTQAALQFGAMVALHVLEAHNLTIDCYPDPWSTLYDEFLAGTTVEHAANAVANAIRAR